MLAVYATKLGGDTPLDNLEIGERPQPLPGAGEARIRTKAASLNHHDYWTLKGVVGLPVTLPRILGCDAAGIVDCYGPEAPATAPPVGSDIVAYPMRFCGRCSACTGSDPMLCGRFEMLSDGTMEGSFAEYVIVPAINLIPKPPSLTFEEATCLGTAFITAYRMLFVKAALRPGQRVLIQGAGGGLATAAIVLAAKAGLYVIASSRSQAKLDAAKALGAHRGVPAGREAAKAVLKLTDGEGVDAVIESVGEPTWGTSLRALRPGGALVVAGATGGPNPPADLGRVFWRQLRVLGSTMGSLAEFVELVHFVETTGIKPLIDGVYELQQARVAFERLAAGEQTGKLVFSL